MGAAARIARPLPPSILGGGTAEEHLACGRAIRAAAGSLADGATWLLASVASRVAAPLATRCNPRCNPSSNRVQPDPHRCCPIGTRVAPPFRNWVAPPLQPPLRPVASRCCTQFRNAFRNAFRNRVQPRRALGCNSLQANDHSSPLLATPGASPATPRGTQHPRRVTRAVGQPPWPPGCASDLAQAACAGRWRRDGATLTVPLGSHSSLPSSAGGPGGLC